jgi:hypothetical protein
MRRWPYLAAVLAFTSWANARPPGPGVLCDTWPEAKICQDGTSSCESCHTAPPARDAFGQSVEAALLPDVPRPLGDGVFAEGLPAALALVAQEDADGDGWSNLEEFLAGTDASDAAQTPDAIAGPCEVSNNPRWNVCGYDAKYAYRRLSLDVCGQQPDFADFEAFGALSHEAQQAALDAALDRCLDSNFWQGRDGALWRMAHKKIRPLQAIKSGRGAGAVPLGDYDHDYALFVYTQTDDRDARDVLRADYHVRMTEGQPPTYERVASLFGQATAANRRSGMMTTRWFFVINTMFTPMPRTAAAQAYRSYLGLDIAKSQGLYPAVEPIIDYDDRGINNPACAACHDTLDPITYPFTRYWGIANNTGEYDPGRMTRFDRADGERLAETPEAGYLLGQRVENLVEWGQVAAESDAFARATVAQYWTLMVGHAPTPAEEVEFDRLWRDFRGAHDYRVERMLHALIHTEAYGAP